MRIIIVVPSPRLVFLFTALAMMAGCGEEMSPWRAVFNSIT